MSSIRVRPGIMQIGVIAAACIMLAGCAHTPQPVLGTATLAPDPALGQSGYQDKMPVEYPLYARDVVSITVFREPDLSIQNVPIGADGALALPLIGRTMVAGQTPTQLQHTLESALGKGILRHPDVTVTVMDYASHYVTVEGAVSGAGIFKFPPGTRLSGAIALAGGESRVAKNLIVVMRPTPEGMTVAKFDYAAMRAGTMIDPLIMPGDRVIMGKSALSQFWQDLLVALPAFTIFTRL